MRSIFDLAVARPVLAAAINLLLVAIGLGAALTLSVREYPNIDPPSVSVRTAYTGAPAEVVEREVTKVIEDNLSGIDDVRLIRSTSRDESSQITVEFGAGADLDAAAADVRDKVSAVRRDLPEEIEEPIVEKASADDFPVMYLTMRSDTVATPELTDIAERVLTDALGTVPGVASVEIYGGKRYAMRIWLDREALAARGLTATDVADRLRAENVELPAGRIETGQQEITLRAVTRFTDAAQFRGLVLREGGAAGRVLLGDVARVEVGVENYRSGFRAAGQDAIALAVLRQSDANVLEVSDGIRAELERLRPSLPPGVAVEVGFDESVFIRETLWNVGRTLLETVAIIVAVIFVFLGSARATVIPAVTVPASVIPAVAVAASLGYSVNVLSVLAVILSISLCVDDAVVIMENIRRRQQEGEPLLLAAVRATRQLGFAVFASAAVLLSVIVPLAFLQGNVGRLFEEFAVVLAAVVAFSTLAALTLGPMLSARLFTAGGDDGWFARHSRAAQEWVSARYRRLVAGAVARPWLPLLVGLAFAGAGVMAYLAVPAELAPDEDRGGATVVVEAPEGAGYDYTLEQVLRIERSLEPLLARNGGPVEQVLSIVGPGRDQLSQPNLARLILRLRPWDEREMPQGEVIDQLRGRLRDIPGVRAFAVAPPKLGQRRRGRQLRFFVAGVDREQIRQGAEAVFARIGEVPGVVAPDLGYKDTLPQLEIMLDRDRAAALGVDAQAIGDTLRILFGSQEVTRYVDRGEEYEVILQARPEDRSAPSDLRGVYVRARTGDLVPLSSVVRTREVGAVRELTRVDRLAAVEISANLAPGTPIGEALARLEAIAAEELPQGAQVRLLGEALDYRETGNAVVVILALVLLLTFLVLAGQFESFLHPLVVMTAPLALAGGLVTLWVFGLTLNIYSQIGMILLVGLVAKNGILLVEFANQLREEGREPAAAAEEAAALRLRPILMTTFAAIIGALPLAAAEGAGGESRSTIGLVVAGGTTLGTLLTLFVVPALYALVARLARAPGELEAEIARLEREHPERGEAAQPAE